ncbi:unnamed protein product [Prorocentrum cordatum]|uniref:Uncharacterized protein n=1 Tax=Prorocentrum cordatum TaxID=2364126 RepID=A0ABN9T8K4_9DINO|nr:unnamed protein product [Polarella glacialis]
MAPAPAGGRNADEWRAAREWARRSADRAVLKLSEEIARTRDHLAVVEDALAAVVGCNEVAPRLRALPPALRETLAGPAPTWLETLRRKVALHADADGVDVATAGEAALKRAQKGPRLEARLEAERGSAAVGARLSPDAAPFVPASCFAPGAWDVEQLAAGDQRVASVQPQEQEALETEHEALGVQDGPTFDGSGLPIVGGCSGAPCEGTAEVSAGTSATELEAFFRGAKERMKPAALAIAEAGSRGLDDDSEAQRAELAAAADRLVELEAFVVGEIVPAGLAPFAAEGGPAVGATAAAASGRAAVSRGTGGRGMLGTGGDDGFDVELEAADRGSGGPQHGGPQAATAARARDLAQLFASCVAEISSWVGVGRASG